MQVSATLIAAQQAAREAQARFHAQHVAAPPQNFAAALNKQEGFAPLPLKQTATPAPVAPAEPKAVAGRLGAQLNIVV
jgi:hypothetical protein